METNKEKPAEIQRVEPGEIQMAQVDPNASMMTQIMQLTQQGHKLDVDYIKGLRTLQKEIADDEARISFAAAFTIVQSEIECVVKGKFNPQTKSKYAGLDDVIEMCKPVYTKHGFSVIFSEGEAKEAEHIRVCVDVLHESGHSKPYYYDVPMGGVGIQGKVNMTKIHAKATSFSYGKRYLLCDIFNIPTQDTDGNPPQQPTPPPAIRPPSTTELEVIDAICAKLPGKEGYVLNKGRITARLIEKSRDYLLFEKVDWCAEQVMKHFSDVDLYEISEAIDEQPGEFE